MGRKKPIAFQWCHFQKWLAGSHIKCFCFQTLTLVWLWLSDSSLSSTWPVCVGRYLSMIRGTTFKMAARQPYWIFLFLELKFDLALNIKSKFLWHITCNCGLTPSDFKPMFNCNPPIAHCYLLPLGGGILTLKRLSHFFQYVILFPNVVQQKSNIFIWNWSNKLMVYSVLRILMAWCFSTRASVATVLTTHPCVSRVFKGNKISDLQFLVLLLFIV